MFLGPPDATPGTTTWSCLGEQSPVAVQVSLAMTPGLCLLDPPSAHTAILFLEALQAQETSSRRPGSRLPGLLP